MGRKVKTKIVNSPFALLSQLGFEFGSEDSGLLCSIFNVLQFCEVIEYLLFAPLKNCKTEQTIILFLEKKAGLYGSGCIR